MSLPVPLIIVLFQVIQSIEQKEILNAVWNKQLLSVIEEVTSGPTRRVSVSTNNNEITNESPEQYQIRSLQQQIIDLKASL